MFDSLGLFAGSYRFKEIPYWYCLFVLMLIFHKFEFCSIHFRYPFFTQIFD